MSLNNVGIKTKRVNCHESRKEASSKLTARRARECSATTVSGKSKSRKIELTGLGRQTAVVGVQEH